MDREEFVDARNTRTGEARKIDEWSVRLPGGARAKIDVTMRYEHGLCVFGLRSTHPQFENIGLFDSDLNGLKKKLDAFTREVVEGELTEGWSPATVTEVRHELKEISGKHRFSLSISLRSVEERDRRKFGNLPVATVRDAWRQEDLHLRSHAEDFSGLRPKSGSLTDPEVIAWLGSPVSRDGETGLGRVVRQGDGAAEHRLLAALDAFAVGLADRLSPDRVDREGFPEPAALSEILAEALRENDQDRTKKASGPEV